MHRSNRIGMGIVPVVRPVGMTPQRLALRPEDRIEIVVPANEMRPRGAASLHIHRGTGRTETIHAELALHTTQDVSLIRAGGVMPFMLERALENFSVTARARS
jgi:aconitate hydratase